MTDDSLFDTEPTAAVHATVMIAVGRRILKCGDLQPVTFTPHPDRALLGDERIVTAVSTLMIEPEPAGRDASALADWADALDRVDAIYASAGLTDAGDALVSAYGLVDTHPVCIWTKVAGLSGVLGLPHPDDEHHKALTGVDALRAFDAAHTEHAAVAELTEPAPAENDVPAIAGTLEFEPVPLESASS